MIGFFNRVWRDRAAVGNLLVLMAVTACASLTISNASVQNQILNADKAITLATTSIDTALTQGLISKANAQSASTILYQVNPLLDSAKAAATAGDTAGATNTLNLVNKLLSALQTYATEAPK